MTVYFHLKPKWRFMRTPFIPIQEVGRGILAILCQPHPTPVPEAGQVEIEAVLDQPSDVAELRLPRIVAVAREVRLGRV